MTSAGEVIDDLQAIFYDQIGVHDRHREVRSGQHRAWLTRCDDHRAGAFVGEYLGEQHIAV